MLVVTLAARGPSAAAAADTRAAEAPAYRRKRAEFCLDCQDDAARLRLFGTKHARPNDRRTPFGHRGLQCEACHAPGGAHGKAREGAGGHCGLRYQGHGAAREAECAVSHLSPDDPTHALGSRPHRASNLACAGCPSVHTAQDPVFCATSQPLVPKIAGQHVS